MSDPIVKEPTIERLPLAKIAQLALRELNKNTQAALEEILSSAAEAQGIDPKDGWGFDPKTNTWARQVEG